MSDLPNHENYNCAVTTESGETFRVFANWLHNNGLDHWQGWHCRSGHERLYIDKNLEVFNGECKTTHLGSALQSFQSPDYIECPRVTCSGCTDDLMVRKTDPAHVK